MSKCEVLVRKPRCALGEGPLWSAREGALYWVDILAPALHRVSLPDCTVRSWPMPEMIGWVIERTHTPGLIAGLRSGFVELELDPMRIRRIVDPEPDRPENRMNDAKADRWGRIWAGTMSVSADRPTGSLYRLDADHSVTRIDDGYVVANGPAFSLSHEHLYHADSARRIVYRYALNDDGSLGGREVFIAFEPGWGSPDGMAVDAEGGLWIAHWGGARVSRFAPEGQLERSIELPTTQVTSCAFGGAHFERLFVTSAAIDNDTDPLSGALFEVEPGVHGLPASRYAG